jgi:hypothetical protein
VPSALNPADPLSRWWRFPSPVTLLARTWGLGHLHAMTPPSPSWGLLTGLQRSL